jgi:hypothetical protein
MTVYFFNVRDGAAGIVDLEGTELPDRAAAEAHAAAVVRELLKGQGTSQGKDPGRKRWCLEVVDGPGRLLFSLPFAAVDPNLDHLAGETRTLIEQAREAQRRLGETMFRSRQLLDQMRSINAPRKATPYLVTEAGRRIA